MAHIILSILVIFCMVLVFEFLFIQALKALIRRTEPDPENIPCPMCGSKKTEKLKIYAKDNPYVCHACQKTFDL